VVGYNPKQPGRPSHPYHTYLVAGLRLVLNAAVLAGNESHANHPLPGLLRLLDRLLPEQRPYLVRSTDGFGNDPVRDQLEQRHRPYLFKRRLTKGVKRSIEDVSSAALGRTSAPVGKAWKVSFSSSAGIANGVSSCCAAR
jgi:hypothetical protein